MQPGAGAEVAGHQPPPQEVVFADLAPAGARPPRGHEVAVVEAGEDAEQQLGREQGDGGRGRHQHQLRQGGCLKTGTTII